MQNNKGILYNTDKLNTEDFYFLFESAPVGIFIVELDGHYLYANPKWREMCNVSEQHFSGEEWRSVIEPELQYQVYNEWQHVIQTSHPFQSEFKLVPTGSKSNRWVSCVGKTMALGDSSHIVCLMTAFDITKKRRVDSSVHMIAAYDPLTGLANRTYFLKQLERAFQNSKRQKNSLVLFFIDLDDFKEINDTYGHDVGDIVLKQISDRLLEQIRKTDVLARYGGDEFVLLLNNVVDPLHISATAKKIQDALKEPFQIDGKKMSVTSSIGISVSYDELESYRELIQQADSAMYLAKDLGRNNFKYYTEELNSQIHRKLDICNYLGNAIENDELSLAYQPQVETMTGKVVGVEVLMRWNNEILGSVAPSEFIPLAEENGLIESLTDWMFEEVAKEHDAWLSQSELSELPLALNISLKLFREQYILDKMEALSKDNNLPVKNFMLEIKEDLLIQYPQDSVEILNKLKGYGLTIALDDFGTGFSSVTYLKKFPIDIIKINQFFIKSVLSDKGNMEMTKAIISLANNLNMTLVAEGVENEEIMHFLKERNCMIAQGNLIAKPMNIQEFVAWFSKAR